VIIAQQNFLDPRLICLAVNEMHTPQKFGFRHLAWLLIRHHDGGGNVLGWLDLNRLRPWRGLHWQSPDRLVTHDPARIGACGFRPLGKGLDRVRIDVPERSRIFSAWERPRIVSRVIAAESK